MRKAGILALSLGLLCGGVAHGQEAQATQKPTADSKADQPRSLIEAVGWRKRCCQSGGDCVSAAVTPAAPAQAGQLPAGSAPVYGAPGHVYSGGAAGAEGEKKSLLGKGIHWSGNYPSWAWRCKPPPPAPPPELYPGINWHRYPRSPRDFFMMEP